MGGIVLIISAVLMLSVFGLFGAAGGFIKSFLLGFFGLAAYGYIFAALLLGIILCAGLRFSLSLKRAVNYVLLFALGLLALHISISKVLIEGGYGAYLSACYTSKGTAGGLFFGLTAFPLMKMFKPAGALAAVTVFFFAAAFFAIYPLLKKRVPYNSRSFRLGKKNKKEDEEAKKPREIEEPDEPKEAVLYRGGIDDDKGYDLSAAPRAERISGFDFAYPNAGLGEDIPAPLDRRAQARQTLFGEGEPRYFGSGAGDLSASLPNLNRSEFEDALRTATFNTLRTVEGAERRNTVLPPAFNLGFRKREIPGSEDSGAVSPLDKRLNELKTEKEIRERMKREEELAEERKKAEEKRREEAQKSQAKDEYGENDDSRGTIPESETPPKEVIDWRAIFEREAKNAVQPQASEKDESERPLFKKPERTERPERGEKPAYEKPAYDKPTREKPAADKPELRQVTMEETFREHKVPMPYMAPPIDLLKLPAPSLESGDEGYARNSQLICSTLESFGINVAVDRVIKGPTFSRYVLRVEEGTNIKNILTYEQTLSMKLGGKLIDILAPIPGIDAVGIDVPNDKREFICMRSLLNDAEYAKSKSKLSFVLGKDLNNKIYVCNLQRMPHLLIAGATNSGKSVCLNALIASILFNASPEEVKFIMIDPKMVELSIYNGLPHLLLGKIISETDHALNALEWVTTEMKRRFSMFTEMYNSKTLDEYNATAQKTGKEKMPYIVIVIDELANLIAGRKREMESVITHIASLGRAAGIHLVVATQRPSVNVVTGVIKANLPSRIAFSLTSVSDARTILNNGGPEKLLGSGDMFYHPSEMSVPVRLQGGFIENIEVYDIVNYIIQNNQAYFDEDLAKKIFKTQPQAAAPGESAFEFDSSKRNSIDPLIFEAMEYFIRQEKATTSSLQARFRVGFGRAANLVYTMNALGWLGEQDKKGGRQILISPDELHELHERFKAGEILEYDDITATDESEDDNEY